MWSYTPKLQYKLFLLPPPPPPILLYFLVGWLVGWFWFYFCFCLHHYVNQDDLELTILPASASPLQVLGLQTCPAMPG
jgi:hypothetical protein